MNATREGKATNENLAYIFSVETLTYFIRKIKDMFAIPQELKNKVDKVSNKGLSSNNFDDDSLYAIENSYDDITIAESSLGYTLTFYSSSELGENIQVKTIDLDI